MGISWKGARGLCFHKAATPGCREGLGVSQAHSSIYDGDEVTLDIHGSSNCGIRSRGISMCS